MSKNNYLHPNRRGKIYIIKNYINKKVYIGQTVNSVRKRFSDHFTAAKHPDKKHYKFSLALNKYGKENFYYEILEKNVLVSNLDKKEIMYIEKYDSVKNGYNTSPGGDSKHIYKWDDHKTIIEMLEAGFYYTELAILYGVDKATIKRLAHSLGFRRNHRINEEEFLNFIKKGWNNEKIAKYYNISEATVTRKRKKLNVRDRRLCIFQRENFDFEGFKNDWGVLSIDDLCIKYDTSRTVISRNRIKLGLPLYKDAKKEKVNSK